MHTCATTPLCCSCTSRKWRLVKARSPEGRVKKWRENKYEVDIQLHRIELTIPQQLSTHLPPFHSLWIIPRVIQRWPARTAATHEQTHTAQHCCLQSSLRVRRVGGLRIRLPTIRNASTYRLRFCISFCTKHATTTPWTEQTNSHMTSSSFCTRLFRYLAPSCSTSGARQAVSKTRRSLVVLFWVDSCCVTSIAARTTLRHYCRFNAAAVYAPAFLQRPAHQQEGSTRKVEPGKGGR